MLLGLSICGVSELNQPVGLMRQEAGGESTSHYL